MPTSRDMKRAKARKLVKREKAKELVKQEGTSILDGLVSGWEGEPTGDLDTNFPTVLGATIGTLGRYAYEPVRAIEKLGETMDKARQGKLNEVNPLKDVTQPMMEVGMLSGVAGKAPTGSLRAFAGRNAKTADINALKKAQKMEAAGEEPESILGATNWFRDVDDQWKFEIDDSSAKFKIEETKEYTGKLGDIYESPILDAYPDLRDINIYSKKGNVGGQYLPSLEREKINIQGPSLEKQNQPLKHELQHAIQEREGFARGGSPESVLPPSSVQDEMEKLTDELRRLQEESKVEANLLLKNKPDQAKQILTEMQQEGMYYPDKDEPLEAITHYLYSTEPTIKNKEERLRFLEKQNDPNVLYQRLAGETEARNVETRRSMTSGQRWRKSPWRTRDVKKEDLIIK